MNEPVVARYSPDPCEHGDLTKDPAGTFVAAADYDALLAERDKLSEALREIGDQLDKQAGKVNPHWIRQIILAARKPSEGAAASDDDMRRLWRDAGGGFHGPKVETGTMVEANLLPFLRSMGAEPQRVSGHQGEPGVIIRYLHAIRDALRRLRPEMTGVEALDIADAVLSVPVPRGLTPLTYEPKERQ